MSASVRIPTILRTYTGGQAEVQADGATLAAVIESLEKNHAGISARVLDETGKLRRFVNVYVNDDDVRFSEGLATAVPDGASVSIIPRSPAAEPDGTRPDGNPQTHRRLTRAPSGNCFRPRVGRPHAGR